MTSTAAAVARLCKGNPVGIAHSTKADNSTTNANRSRRVSPFHPARRIRRAAIDEAGFSGRQLFKKGNPVGIAHSTKADISIAYANRSRRVSPFHPARRIRRAAIDEAGFSGRQLFKKGNPVGIAHSTKADISIAYANRSRRVSPFHPARQLRRAAIDEAGFSGRQLFKKGNPVGIAHSTKADISIAYANRSRRVSPFHPARRIRRAAIDAADVSGRQFFSKGNPVGIAHSTKADNSTTNANRPRRVSSFHLARRIRRAAIDAAGVSGRQFFSKGNPVGIAHSTKADNSTTNANRPRRVSSFHLARRIRRAAIDEAGVSGRQLFSKGNPVGIAHSTKADISTTYANRFRRVSPFHLARRIRRAAIDDAAASGGQPFEKGNSAGIAHSTRTDISTTYANGSRRVSPLVHRWRQRRS